MNFPTYVRAFRKSEIRTTKYSLFVAAVGFERRARFVASLMNPKAATKLATAFPDRHVHAFDSNLRWFQKHGFDIDEISTNAFQGYAQQKLGGVPTGEGPMRILVDISSQSRHRIAAIVAVIQSLKCEQPIEVDFVYAFSKFSPPQEEGPLEVIRPVLPEFAGWSSSPEQPTAAILGLGYELNKAVGALEFIEPARVWAFEPNGGDRRYASARRRANANLWNSLPEISRVPYKIAQPAQLFVILESLIFGLLQSYRPIVIPFGPKIFALCSVIVASVHFPRVAVWRATTGEGGPPVDHVPSGEIAGLRVRFSQRTSSEEESEFDPQILATCL
jgi:hypothetical protein